MRKTGKELAGNKQAWPDHGIIMAWGMIASTVGTVLMMLIISPGYSMKYIESQSTGETWMFLAEIVVFFGTGRIF